MAQLFSSDVRLNNLKYEDLPKVFSSESNEYQFMISEFNGALDLMPFLMKFYEIQLSLSIILLPKLTIIQRH